METREAERAAIGCILQDPGRLTECVDLAPHHFHDRALGEIWRIIQTIKGSVDLVTVGLEVHRRSIPADVLIDCKAPASAAIATYRDHIIEGWRRRKYAEALERAQARLDGPWDVSQLSWELTSQIDAIAAQSGALARSFDDVGEEWDSSLRDRMDGTAPPGMSWGLVSLDRYVGPIRPGKLIVIAARPAMGKSALGQQIAESLAEAGERVVFAQTEMSAADMLTRSISRRTGIPGRRLMLGRVRADDLPRIDDARRDASALSLWVVDRPGLGLRHIASEAARHRATVVIVDYLQRLHSSASSEYDRVSELSAGLKDMTRGGGPTVIALAQLSRAIEQREDKMPMMSDLRSSGQIEQDSDLILGMLRPAVYDEALSPREMKIGILKHREGEPGRVIALRWDGDTTTCSDPDQVRRHMEP